MLIHPAVYVLRGARNASSTVTETMPGAASVGLPTNGLLAFLSVVLVRMAWMGDDAFSALRTVDKLVAGVGPR